MSQPAGWKLRTAACLMLAAAACAYNVEPRRPLSPAQDLKVAQEAGTITVSGETFAYTFSRANGLITGVRVLGEEVSAGVPIPRLELAEQLDRGYSPYAAARETQARLTVQAADPARVVLEAEGGYISESGQRFPLTYHITYDITTDGVLLVDVKNTAHGERWFRWLTLSGGAVPASLAKFVSWMPEQSTAQGSGYQFRPIAETDTKIVAGTFIPWFWLGDNRVGLEVSTWSVNSQTYNSVDGSTRRDQSEMFAVRRSGDRIEWENYLVRNTAILMHPGWTRGGQFALAITPSKKFDPYFGLLKGAHYGPHQHRPQYTPPTEEQIQTLARNGYNLLVGVANWRSGDYVPLNEADLRRTIALCHQHGVKVIPYVTLVDLSHASEAFREHGEEWAIEPTTENFRMTSRFQKGIEVENAYRMDPEQETTLMCPGAPGWRAYWKKQIARVIDEYDFDGLYFDFWFGKMVCENARHGCGGRFRTYTILGAREMMMYAYNRLKAKNPHAIIKANTNLLSTALLTSLIDIRLVGESRDITTMAPASRQWLYSSYRLGEPTEFLWARTRWNDAERASFAALVNFLPQYYERPAPVPRTGFDQFDVFRSFGAALGEWNLGIGGQTRLRANVPEVTVNVVQRGQALLATLINTGASAVTAEVPVESGRIACDPLAGTLLPADGTLKVELAGGAFRTVIIEPRPAHPKVLFALGARGAPKEEWSGGSRRLTVSVDAEPGAPLGIGVYSETPVRAVANARGEPQRFDWSPETKMARFQAVYEAGGRFEVRF